METTPEVFQELWQRAAENDPNGLVRMKSVSDTHTRTRTRTHTTTHNTISLQVSVESFRATMEECQSPRPVAQPLA